MEQKLVFKNFKLLSFLYLVSRVGLVQNIVCFKFVTAISEVSSLSQLLVTMRNLAKRELQGREDLVDFEG